MESADVLYCRYLLTHMRDPQRVVSGWGTQLLPKGLLLTEEVEWIDTRNETFALYLEIIAAMLTHQSAELYVGPMLDNMNHADILRKKARRLRVSNRDAATMFSMNIRTWKNQPFIKENYAASVIEDLEHTLEALAGTADGKTEIEWGLRQIVFERI